MLWLLPARNNKHDYSKFPDYGWLASPSGGIKHILESKQRFGVDNDCYGGKFNKDKYLKLLDRVMPYKDRCLFVNPPDVVGDAVATTDYYFIWHDLIKERGLPISYVLQDGFTQIPQSKRPDALFVGGTTDFKLSQYVLKLLQVVSPDYWIHIGRVNTLRRMLHFRHVADSFDGTQGYRFKPDFGVKYTINSLRFIEQQQELSISLTGEGR